MKHARAVVTIVCQRWMMGSAIVLAALAPRVSVTLSAQSRPPVRGTVALEATMKAFYRALNTIVVTTIDGAEHTYHVTTHLIVHGGKGSGIDALEGLQAGSTVVVHYAEDGGQPSVTEIDHIGGDGLKVTEGVVTRIGRGRKQITVRFEGGKTETFQVTDRAAVEFANDINPAAPGGTAVTVYYSDEGGRKVAHVLKKTSSKP
jgi:hypothetical protein